MYSTSAVDIVLLPFFGIWFVELLVSLYVLVPVVILTVGGGVVFGSLKKNEPIRSPNSSLIRRRFLHMLLHH